VFDVGEKARAVGRFVGEVRAQLQIALAAEKESRKLTQQKIATMIGTNRSVINREILGYENISVRRLGELAWALGWEPDFQLRKPQAAQIVEAKKFDSTATAEIPSGTRWLKFESRAA